MARPDGDDGLVEIERHRAIVESLEDGFCLMQLLFDAHDRPVDYRFLETNTAFEEHTGLQNAVGKTARELVPDLDDSWFRIYGDVALTGVKHRFENHAPAMGRWFEVSASRVGRPELRQVALLFKNITERKAAELAREEALHRERLARAEADAERNKLLSVFMQAPIAICMLEGPDHVFTFANPPYRALVNGRDVVGKTLLEALPDLRKDGFDKIMDKVVATGEPFFGKETVVQLDHDGDHEQLVLNFVYQPKRNLQGEIDGILAVIIDVTEQVEARQRVEALAERLRKSEADQRLVMDSIPVLVSFVDRDERYRTVNKAYEDWFGIPRDEVVGKKLLEVIGADAYRVLEPQVRRALSGERFVIERYGVPYRHGGARDVRYTFVPHRDANGAVEGYVALLEDVTERRRLETAVQRQAEFEQQLLGIVSHDLRNPLTAIQLSATSLARREGLDERTTKGLLRVQSSADRALRLVRDLLDFTQARLGGGIPVVRTESDLHEAIARSVEEVRSAFPEREVVFRAEGNGRGSWDTDRIAQVTANLATNALKYSPSGTVVQITSRGLADEVVIDVHNVGEPIAAGLVSELFKPLRRGAHGSDGRSGSIGLGLFIVDQIVRAHGGRVTVQSTAEAGTNFEVRLPRVSVSARPDADLAR